MVGYPGGDSERSVSADALTSTVSVIFQACGMSREDADLLAASLVFADLRGVHSHGVLRVAEYVDKLTVSGVDPGGRPMKVSDHGAAIVVDGGNAMGQITCAFAMREAVARAREFGVAVVAVRGSNHCGALSFYTEMARQAGMIGVMASHALPTMAPWGGIGRILGISPFAASLPAGSGPPIVYDAAFSESSHGKIRVYAQKGQKIPPNWAVDSAGHPTDDPTAAIKGLLQPIGGYKGSGLAIVWGLLSTALSGAAFGTALGDMDQGPRPGLDGQILIALNVAAFLQPPAFGAAVDEVARTIRSALPAPGFDRVYTPGEIESETAARCRAAGIPLNEETLDTVAAAAAKVCPEAVMPWARVPAAPPE